MEKGILIEPVINKKEHGDAIQAETFSLDFKITNLQDAPSQEFNISQILLHSAEGQDIIEQFNRSFFVEKLNPGENKIIKIGEYGSYMCKLVSIKATIQPIGGGALDLLQKNPFTGDVMNTGKNYWVDFIYIRNSNEYKQEKATMWTKWLTVVIAFFTALQLLSIFYINPQKQKESIRAQINEADNVNIFVACHIRTIFEKDSGISLLNYETQAYKENFSTLNKQPELTRNAIRENIILMEASNKMINSLLGQSEKRNEYAPKLIDNANKIIKNSDIYNEQIIEGECAD